MFVAIYFSILFSFNGTAVPLDTLLLGLTLAIVIMSLAVTLVFSGDQPGRFRIIEGRRHLSELRKTKAKEESPLLLGALVRMRVSLPKGATLKEVYSRDKSAFATERLVVRALTPL